MSLAVWVCLRRVRDPREFRKQWRAAFRRIPSPWLRAEDIPNSTQDQLWLLADTPAPGPGDPRQHEYFHCLVCSTDYVRVPKHWGVGCRCSEYPSDHHLIQHLVCGIRQWKRLVRTTLRRLGKDEEGIKIHIRKARHYGVRRSELVPKLRRRRRLKWPGVKPPAEGSMRP